RNHFEVLTPRIYELGGALPRDIKDFAKDAGCPDAYLPKDPRDMKAMLGVLVEAERCAIRVYTEICALTTGKDPRTYDVALAILHEEIEHEAWFSEYLGRTIGTFPPRVPGRIAVLREVHGGAGRAAEVT